MCNRFHTKIIGSNNYLKSHVKGLTNKRFLLNTSQIKIAQMTDFTDMQHTTCDIKCKVKNTTLHGKFGAVA